MGLFDRKNKEKAENAIQVNQVNENPSFIPWTWSFTRHDKPIGNFMLQSIMTQLWAGISNITFKQTGREMITPDMICSFMDRNAILLVNQYIQYGYMVVFYDKNGNYRVPTYTELKFDTNGRVINKFAVVIYSPQYQTERKSLAAMAIPVIAGINKVAGSEDYVTETLGILSILSGQDLPSNPQQKENFLKNFSQTYGIGDGKYPFLLSNREIKYTDISPDLKGLGFEEKMERGYKWLCNLFMVPLQLIFNDASTFNNVKESRIYFYNNTIRMYAESLLKVARELLTASAEFIPQNSITYKIENVPEIEKTLSSACEERTALLEYLMKLKEAGVDTSKEINELYQESRNLLKEV